MRLRILLVCCAALFVLAAAGASSAAPSCLTASGTTTCTYSFTGAEQSFVVPSGVTTVHVEAIGAAGAAHDGGSEGFGSGAKVTGNLAVTSGQTLYVEVGGTPTNDTTLCYASTPCIGGWNGGGSDLSCDLCGGGSAGGGGGASDVRTASIGSDPSPGGSTSLDSRTIVAAGGGGGASTDLCTGGGGGNAGSPGGDGASCGVDAAGSGGGAGGTSAGGAAGSPDGHGGAKGLGGNGAVGTGDGGAGGAGLYGGGGGAGGGGDSCADPPTCSQHIFSGAGGGGGGSNLVPAGGSPGLTSNPAQITISYTVPTTKVYAWIGLKNSDDVGTKFEVKAEVTNGTSEGYSAPVPVPAGSSGFNGAKLVTIPITNYVGTAGQPISVTIWVRVACNSGHTSGTARLWWNDTAANSRVEDPGFGTRFLTGTSTLSNSVGSGPKMTKDVLVKKNGCPGDTGTWQTFGTWTAAT